MAMAQDHAQAQGGQPVLRQREQRAPFAGLPSYQPTRDQEQNTSGKRTENVYHSISTNAAYRGKSYEEIRLEDYQSGRAGKVSSPPKDCATKGPLVADQRRIGLEMERVGLDLAAAAPALGALERAGAVEALTVAL